MPSWRSLTKIAGSGSRSVPKCHGSATLTGNMHFVYSRRNTLNDLNLRLISGNVWPNVYIFSTLWNPTQLTLKPGPRFLGEGGRAEGRKGSLLAALVFVSSLLITTSVSPGPDVCYFLGTSVGESGSACFWASRIRIHGSEVWIRLRLRILPLSYKGVARIERLLAK